LETDAFELGKAPCPQRLDSYWPLQYARARARNNEKSAQKCAPLCTFVEIDAFIEVPAKEEGAGPRQPALLLAGTRKLPNLPAYFQEN